MVLSKATYFQTLFLLEAILIEIVICVNSDLKNYQLFLVIGSLILLALMLIISFIEVMRNKNLQIEIKNIISLIRLIQNSIQLFFLLETILQMLQFQMIFLAGYFLHLQLIITFEATKLERFTLNYNQLFKYCRWVYTIVRILTYQHSILSLVVIILQFILFLSFMQFHSNQTNTLNSERKTSNQNEAFQQLVSPQKYIKYKSKSLEQIRFFKKKSQAQLKQMQLSFRETNNNSNELIEFKLLIEKFPEGVAIVKFTDKREPFVDLINDRMKLLFEIKEGSQLFQKIGFLQKLKVIREANIQPKQSQKIVESMTTFKSIVYNEEGPNTLLFQRISNKADTENFQPAPKQKVQRFSGPEEPFQMINFQQSPKSMKDLKDLGNPTLVGNIFGMVLHSAKVQLFKRNVQILLTTKKIQSELFSTLKGYLVDKENKQRNLEIKIYLQYLNFQPSVFLVIRDVSHRDYIKTLKEHNKAKQNSLNFVSHEFRTPLNCIIVLLENCEEEMIGNLKNQTHFLKHLKIAKQQAIYLLSLSNDLLDLAQMKVGKFKLNKNRFDLNQLLQNCLELFSLLAEQNQIQLRLLYDNDCPQFVYTDQLRVKQIIINLLGNAFKFTQSGIISILVKNVKFGVLQIIVEDSGVGIKEEDQKNLMNAFCKGKSDENKKLNKQGVGLGLLISNLIAKNLNTQNIGLEFKSVYGTD